MYPQVSRLMEEGETIAVATIVSTLGSTPREVGAKMVVTASGEIIGTVGGGCGEAEVGADEAVRRREETADADQEDFRWNGNDFSVTRRDPQIHG